MIQTKDIETIEYSPINLYRDGQAWFYLYQQGILSKDNHIKNTSLICLYQSLELYLKSYLILNNHLLSTESELKRLGHKITKIQSEFNKYAPQKNQLELNTIIQNYIPFTPQIKGSKLLKEFDFTNLRYLKVHTMTSLNSDLYNGNIKLFEELYSFIETEVKKGMSTWYTKAKEINFLSSN